MISFAAPLARLDTWSVDGRMLRSPVDGRVRCRPLPVPLRTLDPYASLGTINGLFLMDGVLVAFGLLPDTDPGQEAARLLESGDRFLELDADDFQLAEDPQAAPIVGVVMKTWRVCGAVLGTDPCWDLPHGQVVWPGLIRAKESGS